MFSFGTFTVGQILCKVFCTYILLNIHTNLIGWYYYVQLADEKTNVQFMERAPCHTASRWSKQDSNPGVYDSQGAVQLSVNEREIVEHLAVMVF